MPAVTCRLSSVSSMPGRPSSAVAVTVFEALPPIVKSLVVVVLCANALFVSSVKVTLISGVRLTLTQPLSSQSTCFGGILEDDRGTGLRLEGGDERGAEH